MEMPKFIRLKFQNGIENLIRVDEISCVSIAEQSVDIYLSGNHVPLQIFSIDGEALLKIYNMISDAIPHKNIAVLSIPDSVSI